MYYYQFNIGDYASHTNNLSILEDIAYRRLLDIYYRDEGLEESCEQEIARSIGMREYQDEVNYILKKYFKKTKKGFKQEKADREIKVYHSKADAARANGKLGGRPKKTQNKPSGLAEKSESKTNHKPITNNHKPITKEIVSIEKPKKRTLFKKPELHEIQNYLLTLGLDINNAKNESERFYDYYESNGWKVSKNPMKDWQATARNWIRRNKQFNKQTNELDINSMGWSNE